METLVDILKKSTEFFQKKGVLQPRLSAEWLLASVLKMKRLDLYLNFDRPLQDYELNAYREMVRRRALHEPVAYILGEESFCGSSFKVSPSVLIPRPETEELVDLLAQYIPTSESAKLLDLCTGSGAIAVSLKLAHPNLQVYASDISKEALQIAQENAKRLGADVKFYCSNMTQSIGERFDLIVSNPPYIASKVIETLDDEVKKFEPKLALDGGVDGLDFYRQLKQELPKVLNPGGKVFLEIGFDQGQAVEAIFSEMASYSVQVMKDSNLKDRFVMITSTL